VILEDTSIAIDVLANDHDADGDVLTVVSFDAVSNMGGTVSMSADGTPSPPDGIHHDSLS
jgi:hypothetical protein